MIQDGADANSPGFTERCNFACQVTSGTDFLPALKGSAKGTPVQGEQDLIMPSQARADLGMWMRCSRFDFPG